MFNTMTPNGQMCLFEFNQSSHTVKSPPVASPKPMRGSTNTRSSPTKPKEKPSPKLKISAEFRDITPSLSDEERRLLEQSILTEGCREAIVVWDGVIVDGHARFEILEKHGITDFKTTEMQFEDKEAAMLWVIDNRLGRRNLSSFSKIELALLRKPLLSAQARSNMSKGGGDKKSGSQLKGNAVEKIVHTGKEIAALAGLSEETVRKVEKILAEGCSPEMLKALREGKIKIGTVYNSLKSSKAANPSTLIAPTPVRECTIQEFTSLVDSFVLKVGSSVSVDFSALWKNKRNQKAARAAIDRAVAELESLKNMIA